jgi:hypothetical protein
MTASLNIPKERLEALRPEDVQMYLRSRGWKLDSDATTEKAVVYRFAGEPDAEIIVPRRRDLRDYVARVADIAQMLTAVERRSVWQILSDISGPPADVLRLAVAAQNSALGTLPLDEGIRLIQGGRDMLLSAACSVHNPQPYYPRQSFKEAVEFLESCRLGQTERGSFVATIVAPVPPLIESQGSLFDGDHVSVANEPFSRKVTIQLMRGLGYISESLETGAPDKILEGVGVGVSANLCQDIAAMRPPGDQSSLRIQMSWSANRPKLPPNVPVSVSLSHGTFSIIEEVGRRLREQSTPKPDHIEGFVVLLRSESTLLEGFEGTIHVKTELAGAAARIKLTLANKEEYVAAFQAHAEGKKVSVTGILHREAKIYELRDPSNFQVLDGN